MKLSLYPKTTRIGTSKRGVVLTEKLDGSNLGFFSTPDGLLIAQRNHAFYLHELEEIKGKLYKGLYGWLVENGKDLEASLYEGSGVFGEWIGMGQLKYTHLDKKFYMFAKARLKNLTASNIMYAPDLLKYAFTAQVAPDYIGTVRIVAEAKETPTIKALNELYAEESVGDRAENIEGFIIITDPYTVKKYVRRKNKGLIDHFE